MADIFLSYAREDRDRVRPLAQRLEAEGWSVFWDPHIKPGEHWDEVLEAQLEQARCVVVAWSEFSVNSRFIRQEAKEGLERNILVPVRVDNIKPPLEFRHYIQTADFTGWNGKADAPEFRELVEAVREKAGMPPQAVTIPEKPAPGVAKAHKPSPSLEGKSPVRFKDLSLFRDRLQDGSEGPEMVVIPAGEFRMGDLSGCGDPYERPVHRVRFERPFAMSRYPVTVEEYDRFALERNLALPEDEGWGRGRKPVINVCWIDAVAYTQWLSEQTGRRYRLPSEAEWEYAARAGTGTEYWWGDEFDPKKANFKKSFLRAFNPFSRKTVEVNDPAYPPNPWGLFHAAGNVWEWCQDYWHENYAGAPVDGCPWVDEGGGDSGRRVLRGGSWSDRPAFLRSANRLGDRPDGRNGDLGFRLAQDI